MKSGKVELLIDEGGEEKCQLGQSVFGSSVLGYLSHMACILK